MILARATATANTRGDWFRHPGKASRVRARSFDYASRMIVAIYSIRVR